MTPIRALLGRLVPLGRLFRRRALFFQKYKVAPRLGVRAVQRRLLSHLRGRDAPFSGELESTAET